MSSPARQRMVDVTRELLQIQGYAATGLQQITVAAAAPKGSMYHHFPNGKEQLVSEAIRESGEIGALSLHDTFAEAPNAVAGVLRVIDSFREQLEGSEYRCGCPLATVALEMGGVSAPITGALADAYGSWLTPLEKRLRVEGMTPARARRTALAVLSLVEGATMLAKATGSSEPMVAARRAVPLLMSPTS